MLGLLGKLLKTAPLIRPGASLGALSKKAKYCLRGLACPAATAEWLRILENPALAPVLRHNPGLLHKLQRPYLTSRFHTDERLQALRHHYQFILAHFPPALLREIHSATGKRLALLPAESVEQCDLRLDSCRFDREGELTLGLFNPRGSVICILTFSIIRFAADHCEILIGGLQGNKTTNDRESIVALTRQWHGLRPKALLLFALHQLAAAWNVTRIRAVSDQTHIYRHWRKRRSLAFSYNEWWMEAGGQLAADGIFDLPARFVARDIATLKVNKRQMYRRRYHMLAGITDQIAAAMDLSLAHPVPLPSLVTDPAPAVPKRLRPALAPTG